MTIKNTIIHYPLQGIGNYLLDSSKYTNTGITYIKASIEFNFLKIGKSVHEFSIQSINL